MRSKPNAKALNNNLFNLPIILQKRQRTTAPQKRHGNDRFVAVHRRPGSPSEGLISVGGRVFPCALGRSGVSALKREGDGATPLGPLRPLAVFFRADRRRAGIGRVRLPAAPIKGSLGWCDAPGDANYNRPVRLPFRESHERMLREDRLYDVCVVLDWNIVPRRRYGGSAIFLHLAREGMKPTEGCIAVTPRVMARLLPLLSRSTRIVVRR